MKRRILYLFLVAALVMVQLPLPVLAASPVITTDHASYQWGEVITINGSQFNAWTDVAITLWKSDVLVGLDQRLCDQNGAFTSTATVAAEWTPGTYHIDANSTAGSSASTTFELIATVDHIVISPATAAIVAGGSQAYSATAYDGLGSSWDVTSLTSFSISPNGSVTGNIVSATVVGPHTVTGSYASKAATASLTVNLGALHHFTFSTITNQTAGVSFPVSLTAYDSFNNIKTDYAGPATLSGFDGTVAPTSIPFTNGVATPNVTITKAMTGKLTLSGSASSDSNTFTVNPAALDHFTFSTITNQTAGVSFPISVTAYDPYNNIKTDYSGPATLSGFDGTVAPASIPFTNGLATPNVTVTKAMTGKLTLSGSASSDSNTFTVNPAALDHFTLSPATATIVAGTSQTYAATAYDTYGNSWDITSLTAFSISPNGSFSGNVASVSLAGPHIVTGSYATKTATASLQVTPGAPHHFTFSTITNQTAGTSFPVTLTAYDSFNNVKTDFTGPATLSGFANSVNPTSIPFTNGVANPTLTITKAMTGVLTITSGSASSDSNAFTVNLAALDHFTFATISSPQTAGVPFPISLTAYDPYNNIKTDYTGPATLSGFDGAVAPTSIPFTAGLATPNVTITKAMTGKLTLSGSASSDSNTFTVNPASLDHLSLSPATATIAAGTTQTYTATAFDSYGNSWDGTALTAFSISPNGSFSGNVATVSLAGPHIVTGSYASKTATASLQVTPGASVDHFAFATIPSPQIATLSFTVTITALDPYGNQQTGFFGTVNLSASNGGVTPSTSGSFTAGVWIGTLAVNEPGVSVTLGAQSGSASGSSNAILVKPHTVTVTLSLTPGWNLISVPVITGLSPDELFAPLPVGWQIFSWDAVSQAYLPKARIPLVMVGSGYWLKLPGTSPLSFPITGIPPDTAIRVNLAPGWNMIGTSWPTLMAWSALRVEKDGLSKTMDEAVAAGWVKNKLWQYAGGAYANLWDAPLPVGYGYWLQVEMSCTLVLTPP